MVALVALRPDMIWIPSTRKAAGLGLVILGVISTLHGGIGWTLLGIALIGWGAIEFVRGWHEQGEGCE
jgi:hypothetical protein